MDFYFLPEHIRLKVLKYKLNELYEIRLRENYPIKIVYAGKKITIKELICSQKDLSEILLNITKRSIYAYNEQIKQGFINVLGGIRVGIAGECVFENDKIVTIKNISSLNIRIPHLVKDCSISIRNKVLCGQEVRNSLIVSPPFRGKTTILKDLAIYLNNKTDYSILIVDERGEFFQIQGENIDKISYSTKEFAFDYAIRSMSPDLIITDELASKSDWECVYRASLSGVKVIASVHGSSISDVLRKEYYIPNLFNNIFLLNNKGEFGVVEEKLL